MDVETIVLVGATFIVGMIVGMIVGVLINLAYSVGVSKYDRRRPIEPIGDPHENVSESMLTPRNENIVAEAEAMERASKTQDYFND